MSQKPKLDTDFITIYENAIDSSYIINLIELVNKDSHQFKNVERRPHLTMELPAVYHEKDNYAAMELRSIFYNFLSLSLVDFLQRKNINKIKMAKLKQGIVDGSITVSKMLVDTPPMEVHEDLPKDSPFTDSFIVMMYVNDNFNNGELYFPNNDFVYKPKSGDLVYYKRKETHGVHAVTSGERYTIGTGFIGPINYKDFEHGK
jgi:hypothetical protein